MIPGEGMDDEELKRLKRDAAIRAKENDFIRKQKEEEEAKRQQLLDIRKEYETLEQRRLEERLRLLQKQAEVRAQKKAEADKLKKKRTDAIEKKLSDWKERTNAKIQGLLDEQADEDMRVAEAQEDARRRKKENEEKQAQAKFYEQIRLADLEQKRLGAQMAKEAVRRQKELSRVDALKAEAHEELQSFIQNPFPVPLKQVLAGRLRPVPTVTQLLATYKDQREMLKLLEMTDVPMRALIHNQSIFQYVRDIQMEAEATSVRPPEPAGMSKGPGTTKKSFGRRR